MPTYNYQCLQIMILIYEQCYIAEMEGELLKNFYFNTEVIVE